MRKIKKKRRIKLKKMPVLIVLSLAVLLLLLAVFTAANGRNKKNVEAAASIPPSETEEQTPDAVLPEAESEPEQKGQGEYAEQKKVYLTFDDGPSVNTPKILDILEEYHVKATFFTICNTRPRDIESMKRIVESGNTLAIHSVSHDYNQVYASLESFQEDVLGMQQYLYDQTGYETWFYRFPGGSSNSRANCSIEECKEFLDEAGFIYFDWNVDSGDASGNGVPKETIIDNVLSAVGDGEEYVVLMHDAAAKSTTVEALPEIIEALQERGYLILPITEDTKPVHH